MQKHFDIAFINLGMGDATLPIPSVVTDAISSAVLELKSEKTFRGYGPSHGELFLKKAIKENEYSNFSFTEDEIFISNGTKTDISAIQELFAEDSIIAISDPAYPVYVDSNVLAGRTKAFSQGTYEGLVYLPCLEENNFLPVPPNFSCDVIYLCSPHNPTGSAFKKHELQRWVDYAKKQQAIILYDGAYESFISSSDTPRSIYEIKGAEDVAIEFRSFSKSAGFTSLRLSYYVIPKTLSSNVFSLHDLWKRRTDSRYGGTPYPIQRGGEASFSKEGKKALKEIIFKYKQNALFLREGLSSLGFTVFGGIDSPFIWCKTLNNLSSWDFFDYLLEKAQIITAPGVGFGLSGEGFVRFSSFPKKEFLEEGLKRLKKIV